jgi:hypothetical protein
MENFDTTFTRSNAISLQQHGWGWVFLMQGKNPTLHQGLGSRIWRLWQANGKCGKKKNKNAKEASQDGDLQNPIFPNWHSSVKEVF